MIHRLKNIIRPSKVACVQFHFTTQTEYEISLCILERKSDSLQISKKAAEIADVAMLKEMIPSTVPIVISITGKVVLNKEFAIVGDASDENQFLPNNQEADFYNYEYKGEGTIGLSICRKSIVDDLVDKISSLNFCVVETVIGPYTLAALWEYQLINRNSAIPALGGEINFNAQSSTFHFSAQNKAGVNPSITVADEELQACYTVPYTCGLLWLLENRNGGLIGEKPAKIIEGYKYKYIIDKTKYAVLALIFLILMINIVIFESLRKREVLLSNELAMNAAIISTRDSLQTELKVKEEFLKYIGENKTYYSYFLDEIAATVPDKIVLEKLHVNPVTSKPQRNEPILAEKKIVIEGWSSNSLNLNQWGKELSALSWVKTTNVVSFEKTSENQMASFVLEMQLQP